MLIESYVVLLLTRVDCHFGDRVQGVKMAFFWCSNTPGAPQKSQKSRWPTAKKAAGSRSFEANQGVGQGPVTPVDVFVFCMGICIRGDRSQSAFGVARLFARHGGNGLGRVRKSADLFSRGQHAQNGRTEGRPLFRR